MKPALQFTKYGSVAVGSALTDYAVFSLCLILGISILPAQMLSRCAGGLFSFSLNKYWSFSRQSPGTTIMEGRRFLILYLFSYLLALLLLFLMIDRLDFGPYPAKITADIICFVVNFIVMRSYVFSGSRGLRAGIRAFIKTP